MFFKQEKKFSKQIQDQGRLMVREKNNFDRV